MGVFSKAKVGAKSTLVGVSEIRSGLTVLGPLGGVVFRTNRSVLVPP